MEMEGQKKVEIVLRKKGTKKPRVSLGGMCSVEWMIKEDGKGRKRFERIKRVML